MLWGRCYEGEAARPYGPFAEALAEYARTRAGRDAARPTSGWARRPLARLVPALRERLPDLPEPVALQPDEERVRLLDAVMQFLLALAARAPTVLVLDDLHWADRGTVAMLRHVARFAPRGRLLVLGAYRDVEVDRQHPLRDALGALPRETTLRADRARRARPAAVQELLDAIADQEVPAGTGRARSPGRPAAIRSSFARCCCIWWRRGRWPATAGSWSAAVAVEAMRIPDTVRQVIERRLGRLSASRRGGCCDVGGAVHGDGALRHRARRWRGWRRRRRSTRSTRRWRRSC